METEGMSSSQLRRSQEEDEKGNELMQGEMEEEEEQRSFTAEDLAADGNDEGVGVAEMAPNFREAVFSSPQPEKKRDGGSDESVLLELSPDMSDLKPGPGPGPEPESAQTSSPSSSSMYKSVNKQKYESAAAQLGAQLKFIIEKITSKLQKPVDSLGRAKLIIRYVRQLKAISAEDASINIVSSVLINYNTLGYLMVSYQKLLRYPLLTDETLRCILPITRHKSVMRSKLLHQLVDHGSAVFALNALRNFDQEQSIKVQALELLSCSIDFMTDPDAETSVAVSDLVHQLILNGSTTTLPALLTYYCETRNEMSTRRAINCTSFMIRSGPPELAMTLVTVNNWAIVRALCIAINHFSRIAQVESAELMIGLIAYSPVSGDKLCHFGGLDEMCKVIVDNASTLKVHSAWLRRAIVNVKSILALALGAKRNALERFIKALADLCRLGGSRLVLAFSCSCSCFCPPPLPSFHYFLLSILSRIIFHLFLTRMSYVSNQLTKIP